VRELRGKEIAFVPQSPMSSLNPALRLARSLRSMEIARSRDRQQRQQAIPAPLKDVSLPESEEFLRRYPSEISVGQAQASAYRHGYSSSPLLLIATSQISAWSLCPAAGGLVRDQAAMADEE